MTDEIAPISQFINNRLEETTTIPIWVKRKLNLRKKLLKKLKQEKSPETRSRLKNISIEIKRHFTNETKHKVRQGIKPGNNKTLWDALKIAKDQNVLNI